MNVTKTSIAIALLMLAAPVASSTWSSSGNIEPSTPYDDPTWMFADPAAPGEQKVYFNVVSYIAPGGFVRVSPNVAALATQIEVPTNEYHAAILGVWVDCNGDGYIGMAEGALREYAATLLLDDSVCPPGQGPGNAWTEGEHNYNGWVSELVSIGRAPATLTDKRVYADPESGVWGDYGKPDERATFQSCALLPQPRGTYQSTGGALNYAECRADQNGVDTLGSFNNAVGQTGDPLGLAGTGNEDWRTTGLDVGTLGSEDTANSPAYVWDCDGEYAFHSGDTFNQTPLGPSVPSNLQNIFITGINPQAGNLNDPSVGGFVNHTMEGEQLIGIRNAGVGSSGDPRESDCDTSNDAGHDTYGNWVTFYVGEEDFNGVSPNNKHEADWNFNFTVETRGGVFGAVASPTLGIVNGQGGAPGTTAGVGLVMASVAPPTGWYSPSVYASKLGPRTLKVDLENQQAGISRAWWLSFYAHVGSATTSRGFSFPGNSAAYGAFQCGEDTSGIRNGWNCDVNTWYKNQDGSSYPEPFHFARPGDSYQLRDVDCYDGSIGDTGIGIEPAFYGNEPCP